MNNTFTAEALGDYLCVGEATVKQLIACTFTPMNPDEITEDNIRLILVKNPKLIGDLDEFISWYYLEYNVDKVEAIKKRYDFIQDRNWRRVTGYD
jgi:hypothetical protein